MESPGMEAPVLMSTRCAGLPYSLNNWGVVLLRNHTLADINSSEPVSRSGQVCKHPESAAG